MINDTAYISGDNGKYNGKIRNNSVRYGRNAIHNYKKYLANYSTPFMFKNTIQQKEFNADSFEAYLKNDKFFQQFKKIEKNRSPINFILKYMPGEIKNGEIDKKALLAASYEELGQKEIPVDTLSKKLQAGGNEMMTAEALDINKDGNVDFAEYSTTILLSDVLSKGKPELSVKDINGTITNKGANEILAYGTKRNKEIAYQTYSYLYNYYNLGEEKDKILTLKELYK